MVPYQAFPTATIYIVLSPREERFWKKMCEVMGIDELADDPRFRTNDLRSKNRDALLPIMEEILMTRSGEEWLDIFEAAGVPSAPVNPLDRALDNEQVEARRLIREYEYPEVGTVKVVGNPILNRTDNGNPDPKPAPLHGGDTEDILRDLLLYTDEQIHALIESKAVMTAGSEVSKK